MEPPHANCCYCSHCAADCGYSPYDYGCRANTYCGDIYYGCHPPHTPTLSPSPATGVTTPETVCTDRRTRSMTMLRRQRLRLAAMHRRHRLRLMAKVWRVRARAVLATRTRGNYDVVCSADCAGTFDFGRGGGRGCGAVCGGCHDSPRSYACQGGVST